jgi:hypothetical protein
MVHRGRPSLVWRYEANLALIAVEPGKWYLALRCHFCGEGIAVWADPELEPSRLAYELDREPRVCPSCRKADTYPDGELHRAQGQPGDSLKFAGLSVASNETEGRPHHSED